MSDLEKAIRRYVEGSQVADDKGNDRDRETQAKKKAKREGEAAGKARSDADHDRSSRERKRHADDDLRGVRKAADRQGELFGRTFARAYAKAFQQEVRKTSGKGGFDVQKVLAADLALKQGKADNSTKVAKGRSVAKEAVRDNEHVGNLKRTAEARKARRADARLGRGERWADEDARSEQKKAKKATAANDFAEKVNGREQEILSRLKPAGNKAAKELRGQKVSVPDVQSEIQNAGKLTETTERRAKAWLNTAKAHDKLLRDAKTAWTSVKRADQAVRKAARGLAEASVDGNKAKTARAQLAFDGAVSNHGAARARAKETGAALSQARKNADELRDQFRRSVTLSDHDREQMEKGRAEVEDAMRANAGLPAQNGDRNSQIRRVETRVKNLRTKDNGKQRRLSPVDNVVITRVTEAAAVLDSLEREAVELQARADAADERIKSASLTKYEVDNDATAAVTRRTAAERELKSAILERDKIETSKSRNRQRTEIATRNYQVESNALRKRENSNPFLRFTERLDNGTASWLDSVNDRLIYAGRYLSSITQIATTAGAALAAMGAVNLLPLISSAAQAASALATLPALITTAGIGIAALAVGGSGIIGTFKAAKDAGNSAADVAEKQQNAAERVADAYDSLSDARESADRTAVSGARQIASAEKSVQSALDRTKSAQENLNKARKDAADKIRDLNDALRDNSLDERSAALSAYKAGQNVIRTAADPNASWIDIAEAQIRAEQAQFDLEDTRKNNQKEVEAANKANKDGIEGDENVIAARKALTEANESLAESQERVKEVAESVAQANEDANKRATRAARDYQRAIDDQTKLLAKLGTSGLGEKFQELYNKLSPNAQGLVDDIRSLGPEWTKLRKTSQDALTNGLGKSITTVAREQLPVLSMGLAGINREINTGLKNSLNVFSQPKTLKDFSSFLSNTWGMFDGLSKSATPLTKIFVDLTTAGSAVLPSLGRAINDAATRWSEKISLKRETGELNQSINNGIDKMQELGKIVGNTFGGLRGFFQALRGEGDSMTARMVESTASFEKWTKSAEGADRIRQVFGRVKEILDDIQRLVGGLAGAFTGLFGDALQTMGGHTLKVLADLANALATVVNALMDLPVVGAALNGLMTILVGFFTLRSLSGVFSTLGSTLRSFGKAAADTGAQVNSLASSTSPAAGDKKHGKKDGDLDGDGRRRNSALDLAADPDARTLGDDDKKPKSGAQTDRDGRRRELPDPAAPTRSTTSSAQADIDATRNKANAAGAAVNAQAQASQQAINSQAKAAKDATVEHGRAASAAAAGQAKATGDAAKQQATDTTTSVRRQFGSVVDEAGTARTKTKNITAGAARDTTAAASAAADSIKTGLAGILSDTRRVYGESKNQAKASLDATDREYGRFQRGILTRTSAIGLTTERAFDAMPSRASSAFSSVLKGLGGIQDALGGPWVTAFTVAAGAFSLITSKLDEWDEKESRFQQSIKDRSKYYEEYKGSIRDALNQSDGLVDDNVKGVELERIDQFRKGLDSDIDGRISHGDMTWRKTKVIKWDEDEAQKIRAGIQKEYDERNKAADEASGVKGILDDFTSTQISAAITGTNAAYQEFLGSLGKDPNDTKDAINAARKRLADLRKEFVDNQQAANRLKDAIEKVKDGNLDAADSVALLSTALAKQRNNTNIFDDSRAGVWQAADALKGFTADANSGAVLIDNNQISLKNQNSRDLRDAIKTAGTAYDNALSSEFAQALDNDKDRNVEAALAKTEAATAEVLGTIQNSIAQQTGLTGPENEAALNALLAAYGLSKGSARARLTPQLNSATGGMGLQGMPTVPDPTATAPAPGQPPAVAPTTGQPAPVAPTTGQPAPVAPATGQPTPQPAAAAPAQPPNVDYAATAKSYNDLVEVVNKLKTAFVDANTENGDFGKGIDVSRDAAEKAKPKVDDLATAIGTLQTKFTEHLGDTGALKAWQDLVNGIDGHVNNLTTLILPKLATGLTELDTKFATTKTGITTSFDGVRAAVARPIDWLIKQVFNGGLMNAWNSVRAVLPSLPEWKGGIPEIGGYFRGGIIPGYTPGRDTTTIAVGGGESVMRPEFTRAVGADWVHGMNAAARAGGVGAVQAQMASGPWGGAFKNGGIVGSLESAITERFPGMQLTSGYRNEPGSYHSTGQAGDFSDGVDDTPGMQKLAAWIASNFMSNTRELIHSPFNHNVKDMRDVGDGMGVYGAGTMAEHRNHVHVALEKALGDLSGTTMPTGDWSALSAATGKVQELLLQPLAQLKAQMPKVGNSGMEQITGAAFSTIMDAVTAQVGRSQDAGVTPFDISAGVEQWRPNVIAALEREGFAADERNIRLTLAQIQSESSGDPNIIQRIKDVNSGGNEGVGLLQVIPGTFAAYRNPSLPNDRTNPDANISAALRYYRARYGTDLAAQWGQGHGYDQGGWLPHLGWGWNMSGKPEPVFTNEQWQTMTGRLAELASVTPGLEGGYRAPSGPAEFVEMLGKVVAAAAKALKKYVTASNAKQDKPKQNDPSQANAGAKPSGGTAAKDDTNATATGGTDTGETEVDEQTGMLTGELPDGEAPTADPNGDIQNTNPDPSAGKTGVTGTGQGEKDNSNSSNGDAALTNPEVTNPGDAAGSSLANTQTEDPVAAAYKKSAETTRDPAHYQQIWSTAGSNASKAIWDQFTSDLGITGGGFLSKAISAANDPDDQLNQVINYELGNRMPGYKEARTALANPGAAITSAAQQAGSNAQTAVQNAQKVVEEHIHYHVSNIDEAIRKNAIRQQQKAAGFMTR
ncbi:transglycosylase SLT domain-containing protein [Nocardia sp. NPDC004722]